RPACPCGDSPFRRRYGFVRSSSSLRRGPCPQWHGASLNFHVHGEFSGEELEPVPAERPPGAPSTSPAIAAKAEKKKRGEKRARGLAQEPGRTRGLIGALRDHSGEIPEDERKGKPTNASAQLAGDPPRLLAY